MKNINFFKGISALVLLLIASVSSAQNVKFSAEKVFITPGETVTVFLNLENDVDVKSFSGEIALPEGLTFVESSIEGEYVCGVGQRFAGSECAFVPTDESGRKAKFLVLGEEPSTGDDIVFAFEVQADAELPVKGNIEFSQLKGAYQFESYAQADFTSEFINNDYTINPVVEDFSIVAGETKTLSLVIDSEEPLVSFECVIVLPEGLTIDKKTIATTDRTVNHKVLKGDRANGLFVGLSAKLSADDNKFVGNEGALLTFDVTADETFQADSKIELTEILADAMESIDSEIVHFYSPDVVINVTNGTTTGVQGIDANIYGHAHGIYNLSGVRTDRLQKGVNIIKRDGKTIKLIQK